MPLAKSSLTPGWPHFWGVSCILLGCVLGFGRLLLGGWFDNMHCQALLNDGNWLDSSRENWQPEGCMLHSYAESEAATCFGSKKVIFVGDSVTRKLFFHTANTLDGTLPNLLLDGKRKHVDHNLQTKYGTNLTFIWDPFLNSSNTRQILTTKKSNESARLEDDLDSLAMLVLGSGLWYLRYADTSGGMSAWESNMDRLFDVLSAAPKPADSVVILPVEAITSSKLSPERALTMHPPDIDAMNSDLYHRIHPPSGEPRRLFPGLVSGKEIALPLVFNKMLDKSLTDDGVHYSDSVVKMQARMLINLRCNDAMLKTPPMDKTCCSRYPLPSIWQTFALALVVCMGPCLAYRVFTSGSGDMQLTLFQKQALPYLMLSFSVALIFLADRTSFWEKEQKQFSAWSFGSLCIFSLLLGLSSLKRSDTDLGFLNRDQTEEWKGWMQIAILIYHYFGASKISGIYNPTRVLVSSYLFMTGYGHTMFYLRKADFGLVRLAQVLIRLNLFTIILAYTMNTSYISYYFTPLVTMWYMVVYATMSVGARFNDRTLVLLVKFFLSAAMVTWLMNDSWLLGGLFDSLRRLFAIHWSAREWAFRVNLDIWIVYVGMLTAVLVIKIREHNLDDHPRWPLLVNGSVVASVLLLLWYFAFELHQESKFAYNFWHPYVSFLPILSFAILRNSSPVLRSTSSKVFALVGRCSLETFIIQFHFWLAGDTKGILLVIHGTRWRPLNFVITTSMFLYLSDRVAWATGEITSAICAVRSRGLPAPSTASPSNSSSGGAAVSMSSPILRAKDGASGNLQIEESDTPVGLDETALPPRYARNIQHWLADKSASWKLTAQISLFFTALWLLNLLWAYPINTDPSHTE